MKPENEILSMIEETLGPSYKKAKSSFYRFYDDFFHLIKVQFLKIGQGEKSMTIYFGVIVPKIFQLLWKEKYKPTDYRKLTARNGVFNCNINDVIVDFKGKPKIKYWDLKRGESQYDEIESVIKYKLIPFVQRFDSLDHIDEIIDKTEYPFKHSIDIPIMIVTLKFILNKNQEFFDLANKLKSNKDHFASLAEELVMKKTFE